MITCSCLLTRNPAHTSFSLFISVVSLNRRVSNKIPDDFPLFITKRDRHNGVSDGSSTVSRLNEPSFSSRIRNHALQSIVAWWKWTPAGSHDRYWVSFPVDIAILEGQCEIETVPVTTDFYRAFAGCCLFSSRLLVKMGKRDDSISLVWSCLLTLRGHSLQL